MKRPRSFASGAFLIGAVCSAILDGASSTESDDGNDRHQGSGESRQEYLFELYEDDPPNALAREENEKVTERGRELWAVTLGFFRNKSLVGVPGVLLLFLFGKFQPAMVGKKRLEKIRHRRRRPAGAIPCTIPGLASLVNVETLLLTDDLDLYLAAAGSGGDAINFTHMREAAGTIWQLTISSSAGC